MSDDDIEARCRRIAENIAKVLGKGVAEGTVEVRLDDNIVPFPPPRGEPVDLTADYPRDMKAKWSIMRITALRLENAGISEEAFFEHMKDHLGSEAPDVER